MFTDSKPKLGTDSVPFYIDFCSNPNRFGRFTVSKKFRNGQNYYEQFFQVLKKDKCGTLRSTNNRELENTNSKREEPINGGCAATMSQSKRDQHWKKPKTLR